MGVPGLRAGPARLEDSPRGLSRVQKPIFQCSDPLSESSFLAEVVVTRYQPRWEINAMLRHWLGLLVLAIAAAGLVPASGWGQEANPKPAPNDKEDVLALSR